MIIYVDILDCNSNNYIINTLSGLVLSSFSILRDNAVLNICLTGPTDAINGNPIPINAPINIDNGDNKCEKSNPLNLCIN